MKETYESDSGDIVSKTDHSEFLVLDAARAARQREFQFRRTRECMLKWHGVRLTRKRYAMLNEAIRSRSGQYCCLHPRNSRFELWILPFHGIELLLAWDRILHNIARALSPSLIPLVRKKAEELESLESLLHAYEPPKELSPNLESKCPACGRKKELAEGFLSDSICHECFETIKQLEKYMERHPGIARYMLAMTRANVTVTADSSCSICGSKTEITRGYHSDALCRHCKVIAGMLRFSKAHAAEIVAYVTKGSISSAAESSDPYCSICGGLSGLSKGYYGDHICQDCKQTAGVVQKDSAHIYAILEYVLGKRPRMIPPVNGVY